MPGSARAEGYYRATQKVILLPADDRRVWPLGEPVCLYSLLDPAHTIGCGRLSGNGQFYGVDLTYQRKPIEEGEGIRLRPIHDRVPSSTVNPTETFQVLKIAPRESALLAVGAVAGTGRILPELLFEVGVTRAVTLGITALFVNEVVDPLRATAVGGLGQITVYLLSRRFSGPFLSAGVGALALFSTDGVQSEGPVYGLTAAAYGGWRFRIFANAISFGVAGGYQYYDFTPLTLVQATAGGGKIGLRVDCGFAF